MRGPLDALLRPRAIAVVGASSDPRKRGHRVLGALRETGYAGRVFPVNPKGGEIDGAEVWRSLDALPEVPDLALVCTPAPTVPGVIEACGAAGIAGAVVLAVGFGESGAEGEELETCVLEAARAHGVRLIGPNTSGILNMDCGLNLIGAPGVRPGGISLLVQSGNVALALMNELVRRSGEGVALCVGLGNELDVGFGECLDFLGADPRTRAIVVHSEGFRDARAFLCAAAAVACQKPVIVIKGARSSSGSRAARSHTGAVSGDYALLRAGLHQVGAVEVTRTDELVHLAETLGRQPHAAAGLAILSDGGGQGTLATDALAEMGVPLAELSEGTTAALRRRLGSAAAVGNPVDVAGAADTDPGAFADALDELAADPGVGAVLVVGLFGGYALRFHPDLAGAETEAATRMAAVMREHGKALVLHSMYATARSESLERLRGAHVPVIESLEVATRCAAEVWRRARRLEEPAWSPADDTGESAPAAGGPGRDPTGRRRAAPAPAGRPETLTEPETRALLEAAGVTFAPAYLCRSAEEAGAAAAELGGAVALKVVARALSHKTEAGGVALGLEGRAAAAAAYAVATARVREHLRGVGNEDDIEGVLVSPMLEPPLAELLVGARRDPGVGPVLTVGAGGTWVEVLADVSHRLLPVSEAVVERMVRELRGWPLLAGARGRPAAALGPLVGAALGVSGCLLRNPHLVEVEVNPLFVYADRAVAVDARAFTSPAS